MGRGGHNRKPDHLKVLQGTFRKSTSNANSPKGKRGVPKPSKTLATAAKRHYRELARLLDNMGVLCEEDGAQLQNLALVDAQIEYAQKMLFQQTERKAFRQWQIILNDAIRISSAISLKFGLTPADKARVSVVERENPPKKPFNWESV